MADGQALASDAQAALTGPLPPFSHRFKLLYGQTMGTFAAAGVFLPSAQFGKADRDIRLGTRWSSELTAAINRKTSALNGALEGSPPLASRRTQLCLLALRQGS